MVLVVGSAVASALNSPVLSVVVSAVTAAVCVVEAVTCVDSVLERVEAASVEVVPLGVVEDVALEVSAAGVGRVALDGDCAMGSNVPDVAADLLALGPLVISMMVGVIAVAGVPLDLEGVCLGVAAFLGVSAGAFELFSVVDFSVGLSVGCSTCFSVGFSVGFSTGFSASFSAGFSAGLSTGVLELAVGAGVGAGAAAGTGAEVAAGCAGFSVGAASFGVGLATLETSFSGAVSAGPVAGGVG